VKGLPAASLFVLALAPLGAAHGQQLFKCVSAAGKTSYQEEPCSATPGKDQPAKSAPASPRGGAPAMKAGWDSRETDAESDACAKPILADSRKYFEMQSRSFPEAQIKPPVDRFCTCVSLKVASTWTQAEYSKNPAALRDRVANAALKDGPCKPDGLLAEMWRKTGKMK
jgi:hypothetical protein